MKENTGKFLYNIWERLGIPFLILGEVRVVLSYIILGGDFKQRNIDFLLQKIHYFIMRFLVVSE